MYTYIIMYICIIYILYILYIYIIYIYIVCMQSASKQQIAIASSGSHLLGKGSLRSLKPWPWPIRSWSRGACHSMIFPFIWIYLDHL